MGGSDEKNPKESTLDANEKVVTRALGEEFAEGEEPPIRPPTDDALHTVDFADEQVPPHTQTTPMPQRPGKPDAPRKEPQPPAMYTPVPVEATQRLLPPRPSARPGEEKPSRPKEPMVVDAAVKPKNPQAETSAPTAIPLIPTPKPGPKPEIEPSAATIVPSPFAAEELKMSQKPPVPKKVPGWFFEEDTSKQIKKFVSWPVRMFSMQLAGWVMAGMMFVFVIALVAILMMTIQGDKNNWIDHYNKFHPGTRPFTP